MLYNVLIQSSFLERVHPLQILQTLKCYVSEAGCTSSVLVSKNNLFLLDKIQEKKTASNTLCFPVTYLFIPQTVLATGPYSLPKRFLQRVDLVLSISRSSIFLRPSSNCLLLLPRLPATSIFPSRTCFRRQFLPNMSPVHLVFLRSTARSMSIYFLTQCNTSSFFIRSVRTIFSSLLQQHLSKLSRHF